MLFSGISEVQVSKQSGASQLNNSAGVGKKLGNKRRKICLTTTSNEEEVELAAFNLVFENCPLIEMLEIGFNTR